jgi:hypothetical protein
VRLVIAQCTVDYLGRLTAHLPSARRLLLIKADGSVSVHADDRAYKPLNWMTPQSPPVTAHRPRPVMNEPPISATPRPRKMPPTTIAEDRDLPETTRTSRARTVTSYTFAQHGISVRGAS